MLCIEGESEAGLNIANFLLSCCNARQGMIPHMLDIRVGYFSLYENGNSDFFHPIHYRSLSYIKRVGL